MTCANSEGTAQRARNLLMPNEGAGRRVGRQEPADKEMTGRRSCGTSTSGGAKVGSAPCWLLRRSGRKYCPSRDSSVVVMEPGEDRQRDDLPRDGALHGHRGLLAEPLVTRLEALLRLSFLQVELRRISYAGSGMSSKTAVPSSQILRTRFTRSRSPWSVTTAARTTWSCSGRRRSPSSTRMMPG